MLAVELLNLLKLEAENSERLVDMYNDRAAEFIKQGNTEGARFAMHQSREEFDNEYSQLLVAIKVIENRIGKGGHYGEHS